MSALDKECRNVRDERNRKEKRFDLWSLEAEKEKQKMLESEFEKLFGHGGKSGKEEEGGGTNLLFNRMSYEESLKLEKPTEITLEKLKIKNEEEEKIRTGEEEEEEVEEKDDGEENGDDDGDEDDQSRKEKKKKKSLRRVSSTISRIIGRRSSKSNK
eukprot:g701.t1